jgi:hypothetical protein
VGQVVRSVLLLVMAAFTYWKVSVPAAVVLLVGSIMMGGLAVIAFV